MSGTRGRFAPSPTGPLHFGSLVTALASYLAAKSAGGAWLIRIEDVDQPRSVSGADLAILQTLAAFGMVSDEPVVYQSQRTHLYHAALDQLRLNGFVFACSCSRRDIAGSVYPGTCRNGVRDPGRPLAWRVRDQDGDYVVLRSDGFFAYQLAVVVDDAAQQITQVVRGADLLDSTPRQMRLQKLLGYPTPDYLHIPLVLNASGEKLSKQTGAAPIEPNGSPAQLREGLRFLGQTAPPPNLTTAELLEFAASRWRPVTS